jgi:hypothetical protein
MAEADKLKGKRSSRSQDRDKRARPHRNAPVVVEAKELAEYHEFPGLTAFGRIEATRVIDGKIETDVRIFVLSRKLSPQALLETAYAKPAEPNAIALNNVSSGHRRTLDASGGKH